MAIYEKVKIKHDMTQEKEGREQASNIYKTVGTSAPLLITMTAPQRYSTYPKRLNGRRRTLAIHRKEAPAAEEPRSGIAIGKEEIELKRCYEMGRSGSVPGYGGRRCPEMPYIGVRLKHWTFDSASFLSISYLHHGLC